MDIKESDEKREILISHIIIKLKNLQMLYKGYRTASFIKASLSILEKFKL